MNERLRDLRNALGFTQQEFADKLKVNRQTVYKWEAGIRPIPDKTLVSISNTFNASYIWLKKGVGEMFSELPDLLLDSFASRYDLSELDKEAIRGYTQLTNEQKQAIRLLIETMSKEKSED